MSETTARAIDMVACPDTADWINANFRDGLRLGLGGPLIRGTSLDHNPAMWRSDGTLVVVVEHALKRHRIVTVKRGRFITLTQGKD